MLLETKTTKSNPSTSLAARTPANRLVRRQGAGQPSLSGSDGGQARWLGFMAASPARTRTRDLRIDRAGEHGIEDSKQTFQFVTEGRMPGASSGLARSAFNLDR
jgi:hypothetical protein